MNKVYLVTVHVHHNKTYTTREFVYSNREAAVEAANYILEVRAGVFENIYCTIGEQVVLEEGQLPTIEELTPVTT
jgi:uncharacterized membrane protein (UPF0127 family)